MIDEFFKNSLSLFNSSSRLPQGNVKHMTSCFFRFYFVTYKEKPLLSTKYISDFPEKEVIAA